MRCKRERAGKRLEVTFGKELREEYSDGKSSAVRALSAD
jgi:hypothetical protein